MPDRHASSPCLPPLPAEADSAPLTHRQVALARCRTAKTAGGKVSRIIQTVCTVAAILALAACSGTDSTPYAPPATEAASGGWHRHVNAPMVDQATARRIDPKPDSPEAAVVKFLASRARGDDAWKGAMVSNPSDRAKRALAEWDEWQVQRFQLRARKEPRPNEAYVKAYFEIKVKGKTDEGEDEFELKREDNQWRISRPPT